MYEDVFGQFVLYVGDDLYCVLWVGFWYEDDEFFVVEMCNYIQFV